MDLESYTVNICFNLCVCVCVLPLKLPSMTLCECQSFYALCMIRIIFTRKHGSSESVRLCTSLLDLSFIRRSYTISIHLYLPVPTSPCLPAPHLLVILGNGGVCTPTLSPNHHSVCFSAPICVCVCVFVAVSKQIPKCSFQFNAPTQPVYRHHHSCTLSFRIFSCLCRPKFSQLALCWWRRRSF